METDRRQKSMVPTIAPPFRSMLSEQWNELAKLDERIAAIEVRLLAWLRQDHASQAVPCIPARLMPTRRRHPHLPAPMRARRPRQAARSWPPPFGRTAQRLLIDAAVAHGNVTRRALVYDVSRWGRFQDVDESAHYEFICRQAGVQVIYCAEHFVNNGSPMYALMKGVKRIMAAEYIKAVAHPSLVRSTLPWCWLYRLRIVR